MWQSWKIILSVQSRLVILQYPKMDLFEEVSSMDMDIRVVRQRRFSFFGIFVGLEFMYFWFVFVDILEWLFCGANKDFMRNWSGFTHAGTLVIEV